jgi:methylenetetrahydrofolate reductase (NADPH)
MKIKEILSEKDFSLSFEVFPPKRDGDVYDLYRVIGELKRLNPDFVSVTYGAGGSNKDRALEIASYIKNNFGLEVLSHLTCVNTTQEDMEKIIEEFKKGGIENILALRGDPPKGTEKFEKVENGFEYANELVSFIRKRNGFSIGAACYPQGHIESKSLEDDLINLKRKVDAGTNFLITQLFFENDKFYRFLESVRGVGINVPIIPGIMPITNYSQLKRISELSGQNIPKILKNKLERLADKPEEVEKYGRDYAAMQVMDLKVNKAKGIHFYCMNRSDIVSEILKLLI